MLVPLVWLAACRDAPSIPPPDSASAPEPLIAVPAAGHLPPANNVNVLPAADVFRPFAKLDDADPAALEIPAQGAKEPLVIVLEAGSYECPHTRAAETVLAAALKRHPEVARYWLHNPLPGHKTGYLLALAAGAAQRQGRFWELHDLLMKETAALDEDRLLALARRAELDVPLFLKDMKREEMKAHVERNRAVVAALGLAGTPVFAVNGRLVLGTIDEARWEELLATEIAAAGKLRERGASLLDLHLSIASAYPPYRTILEKGVQWKETVQPDPASNPWTRWRVTVAGKPVLGDEHAAVTVVEYLDFTCPFSKKAWEQAERVAAARAASVRFFFRVIPPESNETAMLAGAAAVAAGRQGRWREFAAAYFAHQGEETALAAACSAAGVESCIPDALKAGELLLPLDAERLAAAPVLAAGTPVFYVNGLRRAGLLEDAEFAALLDGEEALVGSLVLKGFSPAAAAAFLAGRGTALSLLEPEVTPLALDGVPFFGTDKAPVTVVVIWDDKSPYCRELWPHIVRLLGRYEGRVAVYQKPYAPDLDPAPPPAVFVNGHRVRARTGLDLWSLSAAVEEAMGK